MRVWGDYACFTRPEMKVERVSYEFPTPSSLRGLFSSIFWKPEFNWMISRVEVLKPIRMIPMKTNELARMNNALKNAPFDCGEHRTQRGNLVLRDVAYNVYAQVKMETKEHGPKKYQEIFSRRLKKGQHFRQTFFGLRQFTAHCAPLDAVEQLEPVQVDMFVPGMLFDVRYEENGETTPLWFNAQMEQGVVEVPMEKYQEMHWGSSN